MTRLLWLAPTSMNLEPIITSTDGLNLETSVHWYDKHGSPPDPMMLKAAQENRPDVVVYIGTAGGPYCAEPPTFSRIQDLCPIVHLCGDASDAGWKPLLDTYLKRECFTCTVNFDGNKGWPKGKNDLTLLTPINPAYYRNLKPLSERPIKVGFSGGYRPGMNSLREQVVQAIPGIAIYHRDETYGSYQKYADFLKDCQIVINVAESASGNSKQVKGRVLEAAHAGCLLLEQEGSALADWIDPHNSTYTTFDTPEKAAAKVSLAHEDVSAQFANNLRRHILRDHSPEVFWNTVLTHVL